MQLSLVKIGRYGSDEAVVLNGNTILTADPSYGDDVHNVHAVAKNLQQTLSIPLSLITFLPDTHDWNWNDVLDTLKEKGHIYSQNDLTTLLLDTTIKDYRLNDPVLNSDVPEGDQCEYALKIEKDSPSNKIWGSVYSKNLDEVDEHNIGLHFSVEILNGVPALSVGISPDENVLHVFSNTSSELAVVPDSNPGTYMNVDFVDKKMSGYCFNVDLQDSLMSAREALANQAWEDELKDAGELTDVSEWLVDGETWTRTAIHEGSREISLEITFNEHGTHIINGEVGLSTNSQV